jgi:hypothetical protein
MSNELTATQQKIIMFLEEPSKENYLQLFEFVTTHPEYDPYRDDLREIEKLFEAGNYADAQQHLQKHMQSWLLSPRVHLTAAAIAAKLNQEPAANIERLFAVRCVEGILSTGDGTRAAPYLITRISDEYDVLAYKQKQLRLQSLMKEDDRALDCLQLDDGSEIFFDITTPYKRLHDKMSGVAGDLDR